jgi:hypothetical protein
MPLYYTLALNLESNLISDNSAEALAALTDAVSLHSLMLNLPFNSV